MDKYKYIYFESARVAKVGEKALPPFQQGQALVRTTYSLTSPGTELAFFEGTHSRFREGKLTYPNGCGYSSVGVVEKITEGLKGFTSGERVVAFAGHASRNLVTPDCLYRIPDGVPDEQAVFAILGSISLHGVRDAKPAYGEVALVQGLGAIGQIAVRLLRLAPLRTIIAVDAYPLRLEAARQGGADITLNIRDGDIVEAMRDITGGRGCEIVVEASGSVKAIPPALKMAANRGRIIILGCPHGEAALDLYTELQIKELSLIGSYQPNSPEFETAYTPWTQRRNRELIMEYLRQKRLDFSPLLTHRRPYTDAQAVYDALSGEKDKAICGLFDWKDTSP
ncbi:MAG: zinc-binding alcohol dehydrogenase [Verrucomicrobia bacterium]|nr:zinc-binding alcohol dehydrogenase [Verrucomicrobiota bacterium]MBU1734170.1 zinc-binding alcohol dehydrogenase [Verrucomicrobiota bacterium]MBU1856506.1 zinc-binding alcohol dehydrogenase [Verrucomicrobiota bacterium]